ncbi:hypothetical protein AFCDBAGC_3831 [Methylobacterium cerastii]|uniref:SGNH/GDSL hydrolase family protein n=1 Tax=Methylobacterium cerastii TaxID=932741 RepID=A0ABQ4QM75_9HYPH|nr:hypothetical protein [Methylobacterium cerastii]GJD45952.1 hypothetical protein AFCDBAGC_3831 [Methylobacterium cerastii]
MIPPRPAPTSPARRWPRFALAFALAGLGFGLAAIGFVAAMDPYGLRASPGRPGAIMDRNQRFMYPRIARAGGYDAAVFGTSTARLLDPHDLDRAFGVRFANLAVNAATPDEQRTLATLFLRRNAVRAVLFALDSTWCAAAPPRRTAHPFPDWLYAEGAPWGWLRQVNGQSLGIAAQVALHRLGLAPARIRGDGFSVFTPPEAAYDPVRAARHIHGGGSPLDPESGVGPAARAGDAAPDAIHDAMPMLDVLDGLLAAVPEAARKLVAFMPVHVAAQAPAGTPEGAREAACKRRVAAIGKARGVVVVDFRLPSPITTRDENYWDALHYRLPVAARVVAGLQAAAEAGADAPDGSYRVLAHP